MESARANLNHLGRRPPYLILALILLALSFTAILVYLRFFIPAPSASPPTADITPVDNPFYPNIPKKDVSVTPRPTLNPLPTASSPNQSVPSPNQATPTFMPTATPSFQTFTSHEDNFTVNYSLSRQLYQDQYLGANRYTFYQPESFLVVYVGPEWTWQHPGREFTPTFQVDSHHTFRYDINLRTLVDIQNNGKNYTIQCIHNANEDVKLECQQFLNSFKFL